MSVVFIIGSEEELSTGAAWCDQLRRQRGSDVHLVVPGPDRKALCELARRRVSELLDSNDVAVHAELVEASPASVRKYARSVGCKALLMVYRDDDAKFQQQVFEESRFAAVWLRPVGSPPTSNDQIKSLFRPPGRATGAACEQLLGQVPQDVIGSEIDLEGDEVAAAARSLFKSDATGEDESDVESQSSLLVLCDVEHANPHDRLYQAGLSLLKDSPGVSVALIHPGDTPLEAAKAKIRHWAEAIAPPMERDERIALAQSLQIGSQPNLEFLGLISASSMLASFGLLQNSASVIIGAMLIAPLMTPIVGAGLALTQGNRPLFQSAFRTVLLGFVGALASSMLFGWLYLCFHDAVTTSEMWARCRPSPLDFCVGLVGGIAASYAQTRSHLSSALAGAAIAAALVPPIATAGLQIAFWQWTETEDGIPIIGPLLLVSVNVLTIMIGSSFVLWARGMRSERSIAARERWVPRMVAMLSLLALLILIWTLHPFPTA